MSNGLIFRLLPLAAAAFTGRSSYAGINAAFPAGNLADPQPKTVCQGTASGSPLGITVDVDLGADTSIDGIAAIATNLSAGGGRWSVYGYTAAAGLPALGAESGANLLFGLAALGLFGVAPTTRARTRSAIATGGAVTVRYLRVILQDTVALNADGFVNCGVLAIGQSIPFGFNFELGSGRKIDDQSIIRRLPGGETFTERGGRTPAWRATWSNLTEAEMRSLYSLLLEIGTGAPLLVVEDPDATAGQAERIHYAQIDAIDFTDRVQLDKQRIDLRFTDLV